jgi:hypothetical protein
MGDLSTLEVLRAATAANYGTLVSKKEARVESLYCPNAKCGEDRPMDMKAFVIAGAGVESLGNEVVGPAPYVPGEPYSPDRTTSDLNRLKKSGVAPALFQMRCVVCTSVFTVVVHRHQVQGSSVEDVAVFPSELGGIRTRNTPSTVAYYLDQAARCESVNARSAAVAMYRVALEHLLLHAEYKGMLGAQVAAVESDKKTGKGPAWVKDLETQYLNVLKLLGNGTLHTNNGDISLQDNVTPELLGDIKTTFQTLLELMIERPARDAARLQRMSTAAQAMTPPKAQKVPPT